MFQRQKAKPSKDLYPFALSTIKTRACFKLVTACARISYTCGYIELQSFMRNAKSAISMSYVQPDLGVFLCASNFVDIITHLRRKKKEEKLCLVFQRLMDGLLPSSLMGVMFEKSLELGFVE